MTISSPMENTTKLKLFQINALFATFTSLVSLVLAPHFSVPCLFSQRGAVCVGGLW